jgi:ATP/maltotriose-dependent transcriptional regulator MalT
VLAGYALVDRAYIRASSGDYRRGYEEITAGNKALEDLTIKDYRSQSYRDWVADVVPSWARSTLDDHSTAGTSQRFNPRRGLLVATLAQLGNLHEAVQAGEQYRDYLTEIPHKDHHLLGAYGDVCSALSFAYARLGRPDDSLEAQSEVRRVLQTLDHRVFLAANAYAILQHVILPFRSDDVDERRRLMKTLNESSEQLEVAMPISSPDHITNLEALWLEGRWDEAREKAKSSLHVVFRDTQLHTMLTLARIARGSGEIKSAWEYVTSILPDGPGTSFLNVPVHLALSAQEIAAELALDENKLDPALEWIDTHDRWIKWSGSVLNAAEGLLLRTRFHRVAGNKTDAKHNAERAYQRASDPRQPLALITTGRILGELDTEQRRFTEAEERLQASLKLADACAAPFERALTLLAMAELRAAIGEVDEALHLIDEIVSICEPLGARPTLERARSLSDRLTVPHVRSRHPAGLTGREVEVLRLIAQGMTDREIAEVLFISHHTVMRHVSHILQKLDVDSRSAAAATAVRLGLD